MVSRQGTRKDRRKSQRRRQSRRQGGGGLGNSYTFGAPIVPGLGNSAEVVPFSSCLATPRPGEVSLPSSGLGLPGLSGGGKRRRGAKRRDGKKGVTLKDYQKFFASYRAKRRGTQRGGRYSFDLSYQPTPAAPWAGGIPNVVRIPCEGSTPNPLNPGPHTPSTQPPIQSGGVGGVDSAFYAAPTAGYTNQPSTWVGSTGAPSLLQIPYEARTLNPACLKTGGGKSKRRGTRRG